MRLETRLDLTYDRTLVSDLINLPFAEAGHSVLLLGPVGVSKTHLATALGHVGIRRRMSVQFWRADKLFTRLRAARLDNSLEAEMRGISAVDLLIIDDFAIKDLDATQTSGFYEIVVERHRRKTTIISSNREPAEWLAMTATPCSPNPPRPAHPRRHTLVIEGPSWRQRETVTDGDFIRLTQALAGKEVTRLN
jgi:DNA replication protein DnaC